MHPSNSGPSRQFAERLGPLHTPSQSFSEAAQTGTPDSMAAGGSKAGGAGWNDKKYREEYDIAKSRLLDQKFNIRDYEDPLLPREHPQSSYYPKGVTADLEARLLDVVARVKAAAS
ncbi:Uu.00g010760.m01.CDS01 [Anthostomella pinea]|uniref:Uu.00g010760.m01.CDS01 n=1 Tax=Anthostomella pinea TaxID=933095 RepID=A0AAI8VXN8_9PEZI|nr:Uu.00g010760.m01.CDS01 [Anthostomella pinea]